MATSTGTKILRGVGITALVAGVILLIVYWNNIWTWVKSLGSSPVTNGNGSNGNSSNGSSNGNGTGNDRSIFRTGNSNSNANGIVGEGNKYTCEFINERGQVVTITGEGQRFKELCERAKTNPSQIMNLTEYGYPYYYYPYRYYYYYPYYTWYYFPSYYKWGGRGGHGGHGGNGGNGGGANGGGGNGGGANGGGANGGAAM